MNFPTIKNDKGEPAMNKFLFMIFLFILLMFAGSYYFPELYKPEKFVIDKIE